MAAGYSRGRSRRIKNEINMVPFIDVMLVLLIIFMVTAPLISPSQIEVPSVGQANERPKNFCQRQHRQRRNHPDQRRQQQRRRPRSQDRSAGPGSQGTADRCSQRRRRSQPGAGGDQRRQEHQVRNRGEDHGHPATRRHGPHRPVGANHALTPEQPRTPACRSPPTPSTSNRHAPGAGRCRWCWRWSPTPC